MGPLPFHLIPLLTLCLQGVSKAVKLCAGGGVVVFPGPAVYAVNRLLLPSGTTLRLEEGAVVQAGALGDSTLSEASYPFTSLIAVRNATGVVIEGQGIIRGQGLHWLVKQATHPLIPVSFCPSRLPRLPRRLST